MRNLKKNFTFVIKFFDFFKILIKMSFEYKNLKFNSKNKNYKNLQNFIQKEHISANIFKL